MNGTASHASQRSHTGSTVSGSTHNGSTRTGSTRTGSTGASGNGASGNGGSTPNGSKAQSVGDVRKFLELKAENFSDDGSGSVDGYGSVTGRIDEGGDLIVRGAYAGGVLQDFLESGFTADSHDWGYKGLIGYPVEAKEDDYGVYIKREFHSTQDAQDVRTKVKERLAAGKTVGLSVGFNFANAFYIYPASYGRELGKYIDASILTEQLIKAQSFKRIRVIPKVERLFEDSICTAAMNRSAQVSTVKSEQQNASQSDSQSASQSADDGNEDYGNEDHGSEVYGNDGAITVRSVNDNAVEFKSAVLGDYCEPSITMAALSRLTEILYWNAFYSILYSNKKTLDEKLLLIDQGLQEYHQLALNAIAALMATSDDQTATMSEEDAEKFIATKIADEIRENFPNPFVTKDVKARFEKDGSLAGLKLSEHTEIAHAVIEDYSDRLIELTHERNLKEGRTISTSNYNRLLSLRDTLQEKLDDLTDLLEETATQKTGRTAVQSATGQQSGGQQSGGQQSAGESTVVESTVVESTDGESAQKNDSQQVEGQTAGANGVAQSDASQSDASQSDASQSDVSDTQREAGSGSDDTASSTTSATSTSTTSATTESSAGQSSAGQSSAGQSSAGQSSTESEVKTGITAEQKLEMMKLKMRHIKSRNTPTGVSA